jgi:hypothetical protein
MKNKILFGFLSLALVFGVVGFTGAQLAHAQVVPTFPVGCNSNLGYSITNGLPCNGTSIATSYIAGCTTILGYSITNGATCDGAAVAIPYLNGCSSVNGFSIVSGAPCNGTMNATTDPSIAAASTVTTTTVTPGLPVTGAGNNALVNLALLFSLAVVAVGSGVYLSRKTKIAA